MPYNRLEFVEFLEPTGHTTRRALLRMFANDEWLLSVSVALTRSAKTAHEISDSEIERRLPTFARRVVERRVAREPEWVEANCGRDDVVLNIGTTDFAADDWNAAADS
jgi:hypothetical protein